MRGGRIDWTHLLQPALKWLWQLLAELVLQIQRMLLLHLAFAANGPRWFLLVANWCLRQMEKGLSLIHISEPTRPY